jgi:hypothetical protein
MKALDFDFHIYIYILLFSGEMLIKLFKTSLITVIHLSFICHVEHVAGAGEYISHIKH